MSKSAKKKFEAYSNDLYWLADGVAAVIAENKKEGTTQKEQVEELFLAERLFKEEILKYKYSTQCYKKFIHKIRYIDRNILFSKIYFRENGEVFSKEVTPCLKKEDPEAIKKFHINFNLIKFIKDSWRGPLGAKAEKLYRRVEKARRILIEQNIPLAFNSAKLFYRKVPKSPQVGLLDMISVSIKGLTSAIDKYTGVAGTGEYSTVFRSVILGRCTGELIREYSCTQIHFFPSDRKILYKANSIRGRQGITDIYQLAVAINEAFLADAKEGIQVPKEQVTAAELQELLHAASIVSVECTYGEDDFNQYDRTPCEVSNAEETLIHIETNQKVAKLIGELPPLNQKVLRLKGVNF